MECHFETGKRNFVEKFNMFEVLYLFCFNYCVSKVPSYHKNLKVIIHDFTFCVKILYYDHVRHDFAAEFKLLKSMLVF
jgi:hypothetical protein